MSIADRTQALRESLPQGVDLIAVSKTHPTQAIEDAYAGGQRHFGESYAQELRDKAPALPSDIHWHFIGKIQRNKLKYIAPHAYRVHGLTKLNQAEELVKRAPGPVSGLINVNLGREASKVGVFPEDVLSLAASLHQVDGFQLCGLMCIPPFTEVPEDVAPWFEELADLAARGRAAGLPLTELSMGMSRDWKVAVAHGARWIRVGTALFGARGT